MKNREQEPSQEYVKGVKAFPEKLPKISYEVDVSKHALNHFWCPYCGGWHGSSTPPFLAGANSEPVSLPPKAITKIVREVVEAETNVKWKPLAERWEEKGTIDGEPARIKQDGDRMRVIWDGTGDPDPYNHREIITNDGVNAEYVRDLDDQVIVNMNKEDPYEPYKRDTSNRYTFE